MLLSRWLDRLVSQVGVSSRSLRSRRSLSVPAQVETLEDRCLLAAFFVTSLNDSGPGSLRQAVLDANGNGNPGEVDFIRFAPALLNTSRIVTLTSGQLTISQSVSILGPTFDPAGIIVSGGDNSRVFEVAASAQLALFQYFTITRGNASGDGGGLFNQGPNTILTDMVISGNSADFGGGISNNSGRLEIQRSQIISNSAFSDGGGVNTVDGTLLINDTTIADNLADSNGGGVAIQAGADQTIIDGSTINGNTANFGMGGGVASFSSTSTALTIRNSTIVDNISTFGGAGIGTTAGTINLLNLTVVNNIDFDFGSSTGGGGISRTGTGTLSSTNSIVAQNFSNSGNGDTNPDAINGSGIANRIGGDPQLGPLQDNGGPTFTMMPLPGSSVLGQGVTSGTTMLDQRGFARAVSAGGNGTPSVDQGAVEFFPTLTQPYIVGPGANTGTMGSRSFSSNSRSRSPRFENQPYPGFFGEIRVALADINGDGTKDIITAPGPGGGPHILVRNGIDPSQVLQGFLAYVPQFIGGVYVAAGDINGDGTPDIITGSGPGSGHVRVFNGQNPANVLLELFPFGGFAGGVRVASGDIDNDGRADLIVAAGPGAGPHVKVYSGDEVLAVPNDNSLIDGPLASFFAYSPAFIGGVFVAVGDMNNNLGDELITGAGEGAAPHVLVFTNTQPAPIVGLFAYGITFTGGVRVGVVDFDGDGFEDIVTGAGPGGGPHVRILSGRILTNFSAPTDLASFFAFDSSFTGGVFVGGSDASLAGGSPLHVDSSFSLPEAPATGISAEDLSEITQAAVDRFESAGLGPAGISLLQNVSFELADLGGTLLGLTVGHRIFIDADAAGFGFFVDATPGDDIEFQTAISGEARGRVDLLSVIIHELAHRLGLPDRDADVDPGNVLADRLAPGVRRIITEEELAGLDAVFLSEDLTAGLD